MSIKDQRLKQIVGTLKYGEFDGKFNKKGWLIVALCVVVMLGIIIFVAISICKATAVDGGTIAALCGCGVMALVPISMLVIVSLNEKHKKEIKLWLNDAVELFAYSTKLGVKNNGMLMSSYQISVDFKYNGKKYKKYSQGTNEGFDCIWSNYLDKYIKILYSPKYDEVMILKDNDEK